MLAAIGGIGAMAERHQLRPDASTRRIPLVQAATEVIDRHAPAARRNDQDGSA
ncbi:MAG: hypothetical protein ABJD68_06275 [Nakamurella sp.]